MTARRKIFAAVILSLALTTLEGCAPKAPPPPPTPLEPRVAALIDKVKTLPDSSARTDAVYELAEVSPLPPEAIAALADAIRVTPQNFQVERVATQGLAKAGARAIPALTSLLADKAAMIRGSAAMALHSAAQGNPQTRPMLVDAFNPESGWSENYQGDLASVLAVGPAIVPLLNKALANESPHIRAGAAATLARMGEIDRTWNHRNTHTIPPTVFAGPADLAPTAPALARLLNDPDQNVREHAALALAYADSNDSRAVPILVDTLQDRDLNLQASAVTALSIMGRAAKDALPALERTLASPNFAAAGRVPHALAAMGGADLCPVLADAVRGGNVVVRTPAAQAMAELWPACPQTIPTLIATLSDRDSAASDALIGLRGGAAVPALAASLKNPDLQVRESAVRVLSIMLPYSPQVIDALTLALKDRNIDVRNRAAMALTRAGGEPRQAGIAELEQEAAQRDRRYTRRQMVARISADAYYKYPLSLKYLFPISHRGIHPDFLVALYTGRSSPERLVFWKKVGPDQYQQASVIEPDNADEHFESPTFFRPPGQPPGDRVWCVDVPFDLSGTRTDQVFSIDRGVLSTVEIGPPLEHYRHRLGPGERVLRPPINSFTDDHLTFTFSIWKAADPVCCPTGGQVTGSYKFFQGHFGSVAVAAFPIGAGLESRPAAGFTSGSGFRPLPPTPWLGRSAIRPAFVPGRPGGFMFEPLPVLPAAPPPRHFILVVTEPLTRRLTVPKT